MGHYKPELIPEAATAITPREREILRLYAVGYTERGVAARLGVSRSTIRSTLCRLYDRWQVNETPGMALARVCVVLALAQRVFTVGELAETLRKELAA